MDSKKKTNKTRCRACPASGFCSDVCYNRDVPDANCAHAVKYDKLNKRVASLEGQVETVKFMPLKQRDAELEKLWDEFTDSPYVRDAQIYCGTIDEDIYSEENEDNWYDTSGPVLLVDRDFKTLDELRKTVLNIYPDMDLCTLRAIRVSAETVCL